MVFVTVIVVFGLFLSALCFTQPFKHTDSELQTENDKGHISKLDLLRMKINNNLQYADKNNMKSQAFGKEHKEMLERPQRSVFSENFQYLVFGDELENNIINVREATPSKEQIKEIENRDFINPKIFGALSMQGDIAANSIRNPIFSSKRNKREAPKKEPLITDFTDSGVPEILTSAKSESAGKAEEVEPELLIVIDNDKFNEFDGSTEEILDYMGKFVRGINNIFAPIDSPRIKFRLTAVSSMKTAGAQPFVERNKGLDEKFGHASKLLDDFGDWVFKNKDTIPKHDMALLVVAEELKHKQSGKEVGGVAILKGACYIGRRSMAVSLVRDTGRELTGIYSASHQLAHNLGAPHDGEGDAKDCPRKDGFVMSFEGTTKPKTHIFSNCSAQLMANYITSTAGECLYSIQNQDSVPIPKDSPGEQNKDLDSICKQYTYMMNAIADTYNFAPTDHCTAVQCMYSTNNKRISSREIKIAPEGLPCGDGGTCHDAQCTGEKTAYVKPADQMDFYVKKRLILLEDDEEASII